MMQLPKQADEKVRDVVLYFTYNSNVPLSAKRIQKLAYLAELRAIERLGRRLTEAVFLNYKYGPWSPEVALATEETPELKEEDKDTPKGKGKFFSPAQPKARILALDEDEIGLLNEILQRWIRVDTDAIAAATKTAPPFIWTKRFGEPIPFKDYEVFAEAYRKAKADRMEAAVVLDSKEAVRSFVKDLA